MLSKLGCDRLVGILFIAIFVAFAIVLLFGETEVEWELDKIKKSLQEIIDSQEVWATSEAFFLVGAFALMLAVVGSL